MDPLGDHTGGETRVIMSIRRKQIAADVEQLLEENNVHEPPVPVEEIAKSCGLQIQYERLDTDLSGFVTDPEHGAVIGVNTAHPLVRRRFTIAHELGHFRLHRDTTLHVDRAFLMKRSEKSSKGVDDDEIEANLFAAELLMPRGLIKADLDSIQEIDITDDKVIATLARKYVVSSQAFILRLVNLDYIHQGGA
jgi:Zn-dependent peptidase ImmA (M78 family)